MNDTVPVPQTDISEGASRYLIWLKQAKYDLSAAFLSLEHEYYEWAAYQAEQSVEKGLKAILVHAGNKAPKIHKLGILMGFCNGVNKQFLNTKFNYKHIESFTFISRYPFLLPDKNKAPHEIITEKDANQALMEASEILIKITEILAASGAPKQVNVSEPLMEEPTYSPERIKARISEIRDLLVKEFAPESIILFGRFARETDKAVSGTMDVLIIANCDNCSFVERIFRAREATKGGGPIVEPLVYTPEEIKILREEGEAFLKSAFDEGKLIYQKNG
jgi:HEPN domain-containing protein